jgi:universal stress protein E
METPMSGRRILAIVDPTTTEQPAVARAAELAERLSADLEIFLCHYDPDIAAGRFSTIWLEGPTRERLMTILEKKLEDIAAPLRDRGLGVATEVTWDHPLDEGLIRKIASSRPWLVVKDTHHHNVLKRTILSNTDWSLIRRCPAPLLLVKLDPATPPQKICAAIDPMHEHDKPAALDDAIFRMAETLANACAAELHVLHTFAVRAEPVGLEAPAVGKFAEAIQQEHERAFRGFLATHSVPSDNAHLLEGTAVERLVDFAIRDAIDLMVMGAVSRSGLDRIFVGSTAERVLDRLPCDLLIVKSQQQVAALEGRA